MFKAIELKLYYMRFTYYGKFISLHATLWQVEIEFKFKYLWKKLR